MHLLICFGRIAMESRLVGHESMPPLLLAFNAPLLPAYTSHTSNQRQVRRQPTAAAPELPLRPPPPNASTATTGLARLSVGVGAGAVHGNSRIMPYMQPRPF